MSTRFVKNKADGVTRRVGRAGLHALAPDDFEYYACTLELVNSDFKIEEIFHFPVMPNGITIGRQSLASIKKTGRSYLTQISDSFVGRTISLSGTFGRKFRLLLSTQKNGNALTGKGGQFDLKVKTGYGSLKLLEKIIERSYFLGNSQPRFLIFHNHTFNQSYYVEVTNFQVSQSLENNMVWNYTLDLKALADFRANISTTDARRRLVKLLAADVINQTANDLFREIKPSELIQEGIGNAL